MNNLLGKRIKKLEDKKPKGVVHNILLEKGESAVEGMARYQREHIINEQDGVIFLGLK